MFLPRMQQIADGARRVRCDMGIPARITGDHQVSVTRSVESTALFPPADLYGMPGTVTASLIPGNGDTPG